MSFLHALISHSTPYISLRGKVQAAPLMWKQGVVMLRRNRYLTTTQPPPPIRDNLTRTTRLKQQQQQTFVKQSWSPKTNNKDDPHTRLGKLLTSKITRCSTVDELVALVFAEQKHFNQVNITAALHRMGVLQSQQPQGTSNTTTPTKAINNAVNMLLQACISLQSSQKPMQGRELGCIVMALTNGRFLVPQIVDPHIFRSFMETALKSNMKSWSDLDISTLLQSVVKLGDQSALPQKMLHDYFKSVSAICAERMASLDVRTFETIYASFQSAKFVDANIHEHLQNKIAHLHKQKATLAADSLTLLQRLLTRRIVQCTTVEELVDVVLKYGNDFDEKNITSALDILGLSRGFRQVVRRGSTRTIAEVQPDPPHLADAVNLLLLRRSEAFRASASPVSGYTLYMTIMGVANGRFIPPLVDEKVFIHVVENALKVDIKRLDQSDVSKLVRGIAILAGLVDNLSPELAQGFFMTVNNTCVEGMKSFDLGSLIYVCASLRLVNNSQMPLLDLMEKELATRDVSTLKLNELVVAVRTFCSVAELQRECLKRGLHEVDDAAICSMFGSMSRNKRADEFLFALANECVRRGLATFSTTQLIRLCQNVMSECPTPRHPGLLRALEAELQKRNPDEFTTKQRETMVAFLAACKDVSPPPT